MITTIVSNNNIIHWLQILKQTMETAIY